MNNKRHNRFFIPGNDSPVTRQQYENHIERAGGLSDYQLDNLRTMRRNLISMLGQCEDMLGVERSIKKRRQ